MFLKYKNTKFNIKNKLPTKIKVGIFFIVLICLGVSLLSFFLDIRFGDVRFIDYSKFNDLYLTKWVLQPIGLMMAGIGLPAISCCLQITSRNQLAEPTTLGFYPIILLSLIVTKLTLSTLWVELISGFGFCLVIALINLLLSRQSIYKSNFKLVLIGFCLNGMFTGINWIIVSYKNISGINPLDWLLGGTSYTLTENNIIICSSIIIVCVLIIFILIPYLNIIQKDILLAKTLGVNVEAVFWIVGILSVFIVVSSIMIAGYVMLIGLVAPHFFRIIFKTNNTKIIIPLSSIFGMFVLLSANMLRNGTNVNINLLPGIMCIPILFMLLLGKKIN